MENILTVLKVYDENEDGFLTQDELNKFCTDVNYKFSDVENNMFKLTSELVSYNQIIDAFSYQDDEYSDNKFYNILKSIDKDNNNKVFVPELINMLKNSNQLQLSNRLEELLSNLPIEDHHLLLDKIDFNL